MEATFRSCRNFAAPTDLAEIDPGGAARAAFAGDTAAEGIGKVLSGGAAFAA